MCLSDFLPLQRLLFTHFETTRLACRHTLTKFQRAIARPRSVPGRLFLSFFQLLSTHVPELSHLVSRRSMTNSRRAVTGPRSVPGRLCLSFQTASVQSCPRANSFRLQALFNQFSQALPHANYAAYALTELRLALQVLFALS